MGLWHRRRAAIRGPLRLRVERYVRCPRGGLVALERCEACDLLQGTLAGERLEVLCAYAEARPALAPRHVTGGDDGSRGRPAPHATGERRDAPLALAATADAPRREHLAARALVFDSDWPDD